MEMMSHIQGHRNSIDKRPDNDFYPTPKCLTFELINTGILKDCKKILEPACGNYAISSVLEDNGFDVEKSDLKYGVNFLTKDYSNNHYDAIVTNPPFSLWDEFIRKAKEINSKKIIFIGRANCFGSHSRNIHGIWNNLKGVWFFDRQIAYDKELRDDGKAVAGMIVSGWFVWEKNYEDYPSIHLIDIDKYILRKSDEKYQNSFFKLF